MPPVEAWRTQSARPGGWPTWTLSVLTVGMLLLLAMHALPVQAQEDTLCAPGESPRFTAGFADLKALVADWQGNPITCASSDPNGSGDILQRTTTGLAFWRKSTNTPTFTNGIDHWALTPRGLVYWNGTSIDPPPTAEAAVVHPCIAVGTCQPVPVRPVATPVALVPAPAPEAIYQTGNGLRTAVHLRDELTAAGYGGPWDVPAMLGAYERSGTSVQPYPSDTAWHCLAANLSCTQDPWWAERNALQEDSHVSYAALGSRFQTERRYVEAINLLWQWPDGKELLRRAEQAGVLLITLSYDRPTAYATYAIQRNVITLNRQFVNTPTWMLAGIIAHELQHASDDQQGIRTERTSADCFASEEAAFATEQRFLRWLTTDLLPEGLPPLTVLQSRLTPEHGNLAQALYRIGASTDTAELVRQQYAHTCGGQ